MDNIARLPARDRSELFSTAATLRGNMLSEMVEKDFWVCWTLKRVFAIEDSPADLIFKGGTSLSKVYKAIDRFSEDVDLSFDRSALGFGGEHDPACAASRNQTEKRLEALTTACREMIRGKFVPRLEAAFQKALGTAPSKRTWQVELDKDDPDQQTVLFHYPAAIAKRAGEMARYMQPDVRLEFGARGEQWPAEYATVTSYAAQAVPGPFKEPACEVKVLAIERTFWEKATILHAWHHLPQTKPLPERQSRHYFDLAKLYEKGMGEKALAKLDLLKNVADHKLIFFRSPSAKYEEAAQGSLRLIPTPLRRKELESDYAKMRQMIFGEVPPLKHVFDVLAELEHKINEKRGKNKQW
ncbi:MAG: nucleotidyl transferase AbiEii/AbiGii toxin family protein [Elusimicrobiota bacterium]